MKKANSKKQKRAKSVEEYKLELKNRLNARQQYLKESYDEIRKKYSLPEFEKLDEEFDIRIIWEDVSIRNIRRCILDKLESSLGIISPPITGHGTLHAYIESKILSKAELESLFELYKKLEVLIHEGLLVRLRSEKDEAEFVKKVWAQWPKLKSELQEFLKKFAEAWEKTKEEDVQEKYFQ